MMGRTSLSTREVRFGDEGDHGDQFIAGSARGFYNLLHKLNNVILAGRSMHVIDILHNR
jgi:hypothetical protein